MYLYFLILMISYKIKSIDCIELEKSKIETYTHFLMNKLGIENHSLNKTSRIKRGVDNHQIDEANDQLRVHMFNLISEDQNRTRLKQYDLVKSILGQSRGKTIRSKFKRFYVSKQKRVESIELNERFAFDLKRNFGNILEFKLDLNLDLRKLFRNRVEIESNSNRNRLEIQLLIFHKNKILDEHRLVINQNDSRHEKEFLNALNQQKFKFDLKELRVLRKKFVLRFRLIAKFRSTSRTLYLNQNQLLNLNDLLNDRPVLTVYLKSSPTQPVEMAQSQNQIESYLHSLRNQPSLVKNNCQSKSIIIDFKELGWDHVILEPKYIKTHYCDGSCNFPFDDNSSNSADSINQAVLQTLASRSKRYGFLPKPCCSPAQLSSKHFLFVDENNSITLKKVDNIVIDSCSCR
jgi:hypothetical protein